MTVYSEPPISVILCMTSTQDSIKALEPVTIDGVEYEIAGKKFTNLDQAVQDKILSYELQVYLFSDCTRCRYQGDVIVARITVSRSPVHKKGTSY